MPLEWSLISDRKIKNVTRQVFRNETIRGTKTVLLEQGKLPQVEFSLDGTDTWFQYECVLMLEHQQRTESAARR
jgi:hypothetical protein